MYKKHRFSDYLIRSDAPGGSRRSSFYSTFYESSIGNVIYLRLSRLAFVLTSVLLSGMSLADASSTEKDLAAPGNTAQLSNTLANFEATGLALVKSQKMLPEMLGNHLDIVDKLLEAIVSRNLTGFVSRGDDEFMKLEEAAFSALVSAWSTRLGKGYTIAPIGELLRGRDTSLWRLNFLSGGDEALVLLSTGKKGNVVLFKIM